MFGNLAGVDTEDVVAPEEADSAAEQLSTHEKLALGRALLVLMQTFSVKYWHESWAKDFEYKLWNLGVGEGDLPTSFEVDAGAGGASADPGDLCVLSALCGGWWTWEEGPVFVPSSEWERRVQAKKAGEDPLEEAKTDAGGDTLPGAVAPQESF